MKNNLLDYLSILHSTMDESLADYDNQLFAYDDGEGRTVQESKEHAITQLDNTIEKLLDLKKDLEKLPLTKLREKYGITE